MTQLTSNELDEQDQGDRALAHGAREYSARVRAARAEWQEAKSALLAQIEEINARAPYTLIEPAWRRQMMAIHRIVRALDSDSSEQVESSARLAALQSARDVLEVEIDSVIGVRS